MQLLGSASFSHLISFHQPALLPPWSNSFYVRQILEEILQYVQIENICTIINTNGNTNTNTNTIKWKYTSHPLSPLDQLQAILSISSIWFIFAPPSKIPGLPIQPCPLSLVIHSIVTIRQHETFNIHQKDRQESEQLQFIKNHLQS